MSLGLYLVLIMWACSTRVGTVSSIRTSADYSPELAKIQAMRAFVDEREQNGQPLDDSCRLQTLTAEEIPIETLRRVVDSHGKQP